MATSRYKSMSDDELRALSVERNKKTGCYKKTALAAQRELWARTHWETYDPTDIESFEDRDICDLQYNG